MYASVASQNSSAPSIAPRTGPSARSPRRPTVAKAAPKPAVTAQRRVMFITGSCLYRLVYSRRPFLPEDHLVERGKRFDQTSKGFRGFGSGQNVSGIKLDNGRFVGIRFPNIFANKPPAIIIWPDHVNAA